MASHNIISFPSRTRSQRHSAPQVCDSLQRVVQAKRTFDQTLLRMQCSPVRDLLAERHAKQIAQQLNSMLGYGTRP